MKLTKMFAIIAMLVVVVMGGCKKDDDPGVAPTVTLTTPLNGATGVAISTAVSATFSTAMNGTTLTDAKFFLRQGSLAVVGTITLTSTTATLTPSSILSPNKLYTATITTGAKSTAGIGLAADYTWTFTTGAAPDIIAPTITLTSPLNNATDVALNRTITLTFSEAMDPLTVSANTLTLKQGTTVVPGTVVYTGTTATFTPTNFLLAGKVYTATMSNSAKDLAGNALAASNVWSFTTGGTFSTLPVVTLGAAADYVILAKTGVSNVSTSAVTGDIGLSPAAQSFITGFSLTDNTGYATSAQVTGKVYAADQASPTPINLTTAVNNMITAYNDAAGRPSPDFTELGTGNIGGKTLAAGLYKWTNTVTIPTSVTISGGANDVWIFQIAGDLTMSSAVNITLAGGAQAKNIFWQVAGTVTIGTTSHFEGNILSMTGITFQTGSSMNGRALAQTAVVLDGNAITKL